MSSESEMADSLSLREGGLGDLARLIFTSSSSQSSTKPAILGLCIARSARGAVSVVRNPMGRAKLLSGESSSDVMSLLPEPTLVSGPPYVPFKMPRFGGPMAFATASASLWVASIDIEG